MQAVPRAAEACDQVLRQHNVRKLHVFVQRCVAEQHIDELTGVAAGRLGGQRDADREQAILPLCDALDPADDLRAHEIIGNRRKRHLNALLDRYRARAFLDRGRIAAHEIDGLQTRVHGMLP